MQSRRSFIHQGVGAAVGAIVAGSAVGSAQSAEEPKTLDIIDCHTHFYDPSRPEGVPWPGKGSKLYRTVLPKHLKALPKARPVTGTVIVEASSWVEDNQWLLDLAKDDPFIVGIVGRLTPGEDAFEKHLQRFGKDELFRGIRIGHQLLSQLLDRGELTDLKRMADRDLELDVNGGPEMPNAVARLAGEMSDLRIVVNHIANVQIDENPPPKNWISAIKNAAKHKNVYCKVSALVEGAARGGKKAPADVDFYRPYLDIVWEAFGDDRLIFGSNWPVSEGAADYQTLQQIVLDYVSDRGEEPTKKFFSLNAKAAYKWLDRPGRG